MMRLGRRASLLVAFYVLTSAATASPECAWVLWGFATGKLHTKHADGKLLSSDKFKGMPLPEPWLDQAFPSHAECEKFHRQQMPEKPKVIMKEFRVVNPIGSVDEVVFYEILFRCLPDTVDPRAEVGRAMTWCW